MTTSFSCQPLDKEKNKNSMNDPTILDVFSMFVLCSLFIYLLFWNSYFIQDFLKMWPKIKKEVDISIRVKSNTVVMMKSNPG